MAKGVVAELAELIDIRRFARKSHYKPEKSAATTGHYLSRLRGRGMDFAEVRNYQAGDEIRHMEWRVTARTGRPHIKIYQEEREVPVVILTDFNPSMYFGTRIAFKSVLAARLSALVAWTAIKQGDKVGGLVFSAAGHDEFTPRSRDSGILPWLAALSDYSSRIENQNMAVSRPLSNALRRLRRVSRPGSILVLVSDFYQMDADTEKNLTILCANNTVLLYQICDALELAPPKPGIYAMTNGFQELLMDTGNTQVSQDYQNYCFERQQRLQALCKRLQIQHATVTAEDNLAELVRKTFPRRSRVET